MTAVQNRLSKRSFAAVCAACAGGALLIWAGGAWREARTTVADSAAYASVGTTTTPGQRNQSPAAATLHASPTRRAQALEPAISNARGTAADALEDYLAAAVYPPTSRPLHPHSRDLIEWNRRHDLERPVRDDPGARYLLTADRYWVTGDEGITLSLRGSREGGPAAVRVLSSSAHIAGSDGAALAWRSVTEGQNESRLVPADLLGSDSAAKVRVDIEFTLDSGAPQRTFLNFAYTPPTAVPATFTGRFSDGIEQGSLQVRAGVEVRRPGHYLIDCNLYSVDGTPVAWTRFKGHLEAGQTDVPLDFFGRAIVDSGLHGPYRIGQLRGARYAAGSDPDMERIPTFDGAFSTASYELAEFSASEWNAPAKQRKIAALSRLLEATARPN